MSVITGGYDFELSGEDISDLNCAICLLILRDAMETPCKHSLCKSCLEKMVKSSRSEKIPCPICTTNFSENEARSNVFADRLIKTNIKVLCKRNEIGCKWAGTIPNYPFHEKECLYEMEHCSIDGCDDLVTRKEMEDHLSCCIHRTVECEYCTMQLVFYELNDHHAECETFPGKCPNDECEIVLPRNQVEAHLEECNFQIVECVFSKSHCFVKIQRKEMNEHLQESFHRHMALYVDRTEEQLQFVEEKNDFLKNQLDQSNNEIAALINQLYQVKDEATTVKNQLKQANKKIDAFEVREKEESWKTEQLKIDNEENQNTLQVVKSNQERMQNSIDKLKYFLKAIGILFVCLFIWLAKELTKQM